jgi:hypothetical protein
VQLDAAEDGELDDATRTALERFALGDKDSAKAAAAGSFFASRSARRTLSIASDT